MKKFFTSTLLATIVGLPFLLIARELPIEPLNYHFLLGWIGSAFAGFIINITTSNNH